MGNQNEERRKRRRGRKKSKSGGIISTLILIIALGIFGYSGYNLYQIYSGYQEGDEEYHELEDIAITMDEQDNRFRVDFEELWKINPDIKAWIRFDEPAIISYPIVQGKDNVEYLTKTISGFENTYGAIFLDVANTATFNDTRTLVYGHRMNSGSMFAKLDEYQDKAFWDRYPNFYIYTPDGSEIKYQIFASGVIHEASEMYNSNFSTGEEILKFINYCKTFAEYDTGVDVKVGDKMVVLSTCTRNSDENRYVVCGVQREIRE